MLSESDNSKLVNNYVMNVTNNFFTISEVNMFFHQMFWQQKQLPEISEGVTIWSWQKMILIIDSIMDTAPEFNKTGLVGFPINVILNWPMATPAGYAAFLNDKVKFHCQKKFSLM